MQEWKTLYSRTSTGAVQIWKIFVRGNRYWTISGQIDGAQTQSAETEVYAKNQGRLNETTPEEQAIKEAQSKYDKKIRSGGYFENIADIDVVSFVEPMLAKNYGDEVKKKAGITFPVLVQCKYNGGRCIATSKGLYTRKGEKYESVPHIEESLKPFFLLNPNAVLDGELFNNNLRQHLNEIMKLIRRTVNLTSDHFELSKELIRFYVYDGYGFDFGDFGFGNTTKEDRYDIRKLVIDDIVNEYEFLEKVPTYKAYNEEEMFSIYQQFVEDGQEGAIVRFEGSPYENKRSKNLLKLKGTDDAEFLVTDVLEGQGNWSGIAKIVSLQMDDGRNFNASFKGTMEQAKTFLDNKGKYIGKRFTIFYNGFTGKGIPNYAQFDFNNSTEEKNK